MAQFTPSIGRIVIFVLDNGMQRPAIITSVVDNTTVNLAVMTDIQDSLPCPLLVLNVEAGTARRQWSVPTAQSAVRSTPAPATKSETQDEK